LTSSTGRSSLGPSGYPFAAPLPAAGLAGGALPPALPAATGAAAY